MRSARRPTRPRRSSGCRLASRRWKPASRPCTRTSSDTRSSACASTRGSAGSARGSSTSRRSRRRRGSSGCDGRWMPPRSRHGSAPRVRKALDARGAEEHKLELERTEIVGRRRGLVARVEAEWRKPLDQLLAEAPEVAGDLEWLRQEDERLRAAIDAVGPVNALAVDEHGEEVKRLEFLMTQRNDLVAARQSLQQAAREIDQTAKAMFLDSFGKVRENFRTVFQTLFGGGECDVRLANEYEPLQSEDELHAAPRGKRTQRIHLLSSGERTLVAVSLLFAIFLAKPSPFCLLDEVDAPLDDANVG